MSENPNFDEQSAKIIQSLSTMFKLLGLDGTFRVESRGTKLGVKIASEDAGRVIGRKGQTLESLQLLVNRIMFKLDDDFPHVMLDIDGYANGEREFKEGECRERRRFRRDNGENNGLRQTVEQLEQQARDAAKEVKKWGEPIKMPEMNAHDRRIIHLALQDDPEITTESDGEGALKKVVISLKKSE